MRDVMNRNPMTVTGTPALVAGGLTVDIDQALQWNGTTNSGSAADSASLSLTGSMSLEMLVKFAAFPGSTKKIFGKDSSYQLQVNSAGKLLWKLDNGASTVTVTSALTLALDTWYHVVGVYNGNYAGAATAGKITTGSSLLAMPGDYYQGSPTGNRNKQVSRIVMPERGLLTGVVMDLVRTVDSTLNEFVGGIVHSEIGSAPGALISDSGQVQLTNVSLPARAWLPFPASGIVEAGNLYAGFHAGESSGAFSIGYETSGGYRAEQNDLVSDGASTPFGTVAATDTAILACYVTYTPIARTGLEGKALLYINGALDASSNYTAGIADNANALEVAPSLAVFTDERSVWGRALSPVEIATHFSAH